MQVANDSDADAAVNERELLAIVALAERQHGRAPRKYMKARRLSKLSDDRYCTMKRNCDVYNHKIVGIQRHAEKADIFQGEF